MSLDITLGRNALGQMRIVKNTDEILSQEINTILFMKPGFDEENPDKGVDIRSYAGVLMSTENKTKLEDSIRENFQKYLDATCTNIIYDEDIVIDEVQLGLEFMKDGQSYLFKVDPKASSNSLIKYLNK